MLNALNIGQQDSFTDPVTGFLSRSEATRQIAQLAEQASTDQPLALIWIALDRLKQINTSFGHQGGDTVMAHIARRLFQHHPVPARWYRMSGDEFLCLIANSAFDPTQQLANRLLHEIETPIPMEDLQLYPSASIGIALLEQGESAERCLERADRAMNTAKRAGGGRAVMSGSEPLPGRMGVHLARQELTLENQLHQALAQGGLSLHYQPCVDGNGKVVSVEALMRCIPHNISPNDFIPIAEKTGLIVRLGEWSLLEGARFAHQLQLNGQRTRVSINVSRAQLSVERFPQTLHAALLCADVTPELIELELTESLFMDYSRTIQSNLDAIFHSGVKVAIDDFGTGYSSLAILKTIHANKLKIDRAFIVALPHDRRAYAIVKAIAQLGKDLGMQIVAEGVENQAQLDALSELGVDLIQGYFHARPMSEDNILAWLKNRKTT